MKKLSDVARQAMGHMLITVMSDISERGYYAGWMSGLEYALWDIAQSGGGKFGWTTVDEEEANLLLDLSNELGGWMAWNDDDGATFVPWGEWIQMVAKEAT